MKKRKLICFVDIGICCQVTQRPHKRKENTLIGEGEPGMTGLIRSKKSQISLRPKNLIFRFDPIKQRNLLLLFNRFKKFQFIF